MSTEPRRTPDRTKPAPIRAAGGILEKKTDAGGLRVAVVHRRRYADADGTPGDWALPKGKVKAGETFEQAALREVEEETGCTARIIGPAISCEYSVDGAPKVVRFFRMECVDERAIRDTAEVCELVWLAADAALERLTYETERSVLRQAYPHLVAPAR